MKPSALAFAVFLGLGVQAQAQMLYTAKSASMKQIESGNYSRVRDQKLVVLGSQIDLERYWEREIGQPARTAPNDIDWVMKKVLAVHLGRRRTGGYRLLVQSIDDSQLNRSVVRAIEFLPVPGSYVTQGFTSPWALILVDRQLANPRLSVMRRDGVSTPMNPAIMGR